jgi:predicted transcriptional regulator
MKYRDRLAIVADVLKAAETGAKKTRIMYMANLSYKLLEKYLTETIQIGFICYEQDQYILTEKGKIFLEKYHVFSSAFSQIEKEYQNMMFEREILTKMCEKPGEFPPRYNVRG